MFKSFWRNQKTFPNTCIAQKIFATGIEIYQYVDTISIAASTIKATILYAMQKEWRPEEHEGEQFHDWFVRLTGQDIVTVQNKIRVGEMLEQVPPKYLPDIQAKETKIKNAIADTILDGYKIRDDQWDRVARAETYQEAAEVVREVKNVEPRRQWMKFTVDEHGIIWVHTAEGVFEFLRVNTDPGIEDVIERAKKRLFRAAGIVPRVRY